MVMSPIRLHLLPLHFTLLTSTKAAYRATATIGTKSLPNGCNTKSIGFIIGTRNPCRPRLLQPSRDLPLYVMTLVPGRLEQSEPAAEALVNMVHAWQHRESIVPSATLRFLLQGRLSRRSNTVNIWQVRYCYSTAVRSRPGSLLAITLNQSILLPVISTVRLLVHSSSRFFSTPRQHPHVLLGR